MAIFPYDALVPSVGASQIPAWLGGLTPKPSPTLPYGGAGINAPTDANTFVGPQLQGTTQGRNQPDWGTISGLLAPLIVSLIGGNSAKAKASQQTDVLAQLAQSLSREGAGLVGQGQNALGPVVQYLSALAGGDQAALQAATQPERARVLDQYDTARRALQFLPRGGGQAGAVMQSESRQAGDLASIIANARQGAVGTLGNLGMGLTREGVAAGSYGADAQSRAVSSYETQSQWQDRLLGSFGAEIGKALPAIIAAFL